MRIDTEMRRRTASHTIALLVVGFSLFSCSENPIAPSRIKPGAARLDESPTRPSIVISQIYGGGGNSGATLKNDFIELFNPGGVAVSVNGWSVQYASAAGTTWQVTNLSGTIPPGAITSCKRRRAPVPWPSHFPRPMQAAPLECRRQTQRWRS
jgi:hypothetical protein